MEPRIKNLYIGFAVCILLTSMPNATLQNIAALFSIVFIITAYVLRKKLTLDSFEHSHANYIIRTFWIWSAALFVGIMVAGIIISKYGDMSAIEQLISAAANGNVPDENASNQAAQDYFQTNLQLILKTTFLCLCPAQIYGAWSLYKGFLLAQKSLKINKKT